MGVLLALFALRWFLAFMSYVLTDGRDSTFGWYAIIWLLFVVGGIRILQLPAPISIPATALASIVLVPTLWRRAVFQPLGMVKTSYFLGKLSLFSFRKDVYGAGIYCGMRALMAGIKSKDPGSARKTDADRAWLLAKIPKVQHFSGATAVSYVFIEDRALHSDTIRNQLLALRYCKKSNIPKEAFVFALNWLAADLAERGDWEKIKYIHTHWARSILWSDGNFLRWVGDIALGKKPKPSHIWLKWRYFLSGNRSFSTLFSQLDSYDSSLNISSASEHQPEVTYSFQNGAILLAKMDAIKDLPSSEDYYRHVADYWAQLLSDSSQHQFWTERAKQLGVTNYLAVVDEIEKTVQNALQHGSISVSGSAERTAGHMLENARRKSREEYFERLETLNETISYREKQDIRAQVAWLEWIEFLTLYAYLARDESDRSLAYHQSSRAWSHCAVTLWNYHYERFISYCILGWLCEEAEHFNDAEMLRVMKKNRQIPLYTEFKRIRKGE